MFQETLFFDEMVGNINEPSGSFHHCLRALLTSAPLHPPPHHLPPPVHYPAHMHAQAAAVSSPQSPSFPMTCGPGSPASCSRPS